MLRNAWWEGWCRVRSCDHLTLEKYLPMRGCVQGSRAEGDHRDRWHRAPHGQRARGSHNPIPMEPHQTAPPKAFTTFAHSDGTAPSCHDGAKEKNEYERTHKFIRVSPSVLCRENREPIEIGQISCRTSDQQSSFELDVTKSQSVPQTGGHWFGTNAGS